MGAIPGALQAALADRYVFLRPIGRRGAATVYSARDLKHNRAVAINVLEPKVAAAIEPERFLQELQVAARLSHPHILPLHDSGSAAGFLYYVTAHLAGQTVRELLKQEFELDLDDALRIAQEVAEALEYAHRQGVVHQDIRPENIVLEEGGAVVANFGVARALDAARSAPIAASDLTVDGAQYLSPEQASGARTLDARTDVHALACMTYEMLAGEPPYVGPTAEAVLAKVKAGPVPDVSRRRRVVPATASRAIARALAKRPADRFARAAEFADALSGRTDRGEAVHWYHRPAVGVLAALLLVAAGWQTYRTAGRTTEPLSSTTVAVLPFAVAGGAGVEHLSEGMAGWLSNQLDADGRLTSVEPARVLALSREFLNGSADVAAAAEVARRAGAGLFILGSVVEVGATLRVRGALYEVGRSAALAESTVEGSGDELATMAGRLATSLLTNR